MQTSNEIPAHLKSCLRLGVHYPPNSIFCVWIWNKGESECMHSARPPHPTPLLPLLTPPPPPPVTIPSSCTFPIPSTTLHPTNRPYVTHAGLSPARCHRYEHV